MKTRELKELKLTKNIIIPFPNFQQNTIISPTQMNDNFEEIEYAYNNLIDNHNGALEKINKVLSDLTSSDNEAIANEQERIEAEEIRVNNEEERIANEEERKTEETKRIAMYNVHLNDEIRREQKHIQMVGEFDTKVGEVDTLISTKTEEYNSFVEAKTEEYNTFVETKEVKIQDAINSIPPKSELIGEKGDKGDKGEKGDKGDRGEQGLQGIQGIQGLQGVKGDKGDKGEQGIQGLKGDKGDKGDRGEQGVKGDTPSIAHLETSINNKINDVETRFNRLTSSQQQSSEVIDARDGETSLKIRLDRDIEKAKQVYINVEGSYISTDSSVGYAKDVEILGNTIQDAENLADIRSVGDKVEGQELYEIDVVSCGKNLLNPNDIEIFGATNNDIESYTITDKTLVFSCPQSYNQAVLNIKMDLDTAKSYVVSGDVEVYVENTWVKVVMPKINVFNGYFTLTFIKDWKAITKIKISNFQLEEGTQATPYEPYQEDKLTILSPVQLEKVGDVRDRIIEKDGVWGVEKNVSEFFYFNGSENWTFEPKENSSSWICNRYKLNTSLNILDGDNLISNKYTGGYTSNTIRYSQGGIYVFDLRNLSLEAFKSDMATNNLKVKGILSTPTFTPLPHDQQVKLRTFANKTNISFLTEIEGTIKAQVPKSLGATVNTHTEQISNLNKELDRVKKLEESTVSIVTTESDFTTVEATSNGYFEDVKLEGKTLVNHIDFATRISANNFAISGGVVTLTNNGSWGAVRLPIPATLKTNTKYTIILNILENTTGAKFYYLDNNVTTSAFKSSAYLGTDSKGIITQLVETIDDFSGRNIGMRTDSDAGYVKFTYMLLEGDHTQNPPSYFEGLKSVGQSASEDGADEIVVSSVKGDGNLFDVDKIVSNYPEYFKCNDYIKYQNGVNATYLKQDFEPNTQYSFTIKASSNKANNLDFTCRYTDNTFDRFIISNTVTNEVHTQSFISAKGKTIKSFGSFYSDSSIITLYLDGTCINKGDTPKPYTPHQSDKKRLLFYNEETQTWEKPILREWDSIEKHSDGKYYYHQRSGEVVLNGSENWTVNAESFKENCYYFRFRKPASTSEYAIGGGKHICNIYKTLVDGRPDEPGIAIVKGNGLNDIEVIDLKTKFTSYDNALSKFKENISNSNIVIVYQLEQEKVYECTNIDLITYNGETNYIVESGAITPKTTLKVHNNISNVVNILQEKVSLLENKFIQGLKNVLAGDMYSLAELLYPEDFVSEEEPIDVPTLLI